MVVIDDSILEARLANVIDGMESFHSGAKNPLVQWFQGDYVPYMATAYASNRPRINESGNFLGAPWERPQEQYQRKTDGVIVPIEGGVPRAVLGGGMFGAAGAHSRLGVVTRAGNASIRRGSGLSQAEKDAGFYVVQKGQRFSAANVKGKLRTDGTRYRGEDPQLGRRSDGLLQDWISAPPVESNRGKTVTKTSNKRYSGKVAEKRNFHWPPKARRDLTPRLVRRIKKYVVDLWKGLV